MDSSNLRPRQHRLLPKSEFTRHVTRAIRKFFEDIGEKKFRAGQVMKWIHQYFVTDFAEMTNISGKLRAKLEQICEIKAPEVVHRHYSKDGTRKWVFRVGEGAGSLVETVLIPAEDKTGLRKTL